MVRASIAAAVVLVAVLVFLLWLPRLATARITQQLQSRTGLSAGVEGVSLGLLSVSVDEVKLGDAGGPVIEARDVHLDAGALLLALRGARALDGVNVGAVRVQLPLQSPATRALLERARARKPAAAATEPSERRAMPPVQVASLSVDVGDELGALLKIENGAVRSDDASTTISAGTMQIGGAPAAELALTKLEARLARTPAGVALAGLTVGDARLWPGRPAGTQVLATAAPDAPDEEGPEDGLQDKTAQAQAPAAAQPGPPPPPSLLKRLRAALGDSGQGAATSDATAASASKDKDDPPRRSLLDRFATGAEIKVAAAAVFAARDAPAVLDRVHVLARRRADGALSFSGSGDAQGGGTLSWDLVARPELVQADGSVKLRSIPLALVAPYLPAVPWYEPELGRIDAELVVKTDPAQGIAFSGEIGLRDAALSSARIAAVPVHDIQVALHGKGRFLPLQDRLELEEAEVRLSGAAAQVHGAVEWNRDHYLFDLDAVLPPTPCTQAVRSIPADLLGDLALATWRGKIGGKLHVKLDSRELDKGELEIDPDDHCEFVAVPAMADLRRFQFPFTHTVLEPDGTEFEMQTGPGTPEWTYMEDISPFFVHAVLVHEDAGFFNHHGFSEMHIRSALIRNLQEGRYVVGASTITMQLVKNVFLHREKTLARKIQEVLLTWWIERVMPKRDVLELYLNVIEYGPGIYGIRRGARHYFNRLPAQLSPAEGVFLSTILPNPKRYHAYFERGALTPSWTEQMRKMLVRLRERGSYSPQAYEFGLSELQPFKFAPEGTVVTPRIVPGEAAPLPYMQGYEEGAAPSWDDEEQTEAQPEDGAAASRSSTAFTSTPATPHAPHTQPSGGPRMQPATAPRTQPATAPRTTTAPLRPTPPAAQK